MNARTKKFILDELIPFILREQGRGFAMSAWLRRGFEPAEEVREDNVTRRVPICVACIGGSVQVLKNMKNGDDYEIAKALGLTIDQENTLCYSWDAGWPEPFQARYRKARTALAKAKVAASLLREVVRTEGECLSR